MDTKKPEANTAAYKAQVNQLQATRHSECIPYATKTLTTQPYIPPTTSEKVQLPHCGGFYDKARGIKQHLTKMHTPISI